MKYIPGAMSLAATHRGKVKNIRLSTLRDSGMTSDARTCILNFEKESLRHDSATKQETKGTYTHVHVTRSVILKKLFLNHLYSMAYNVTQSMVLFSLPAQHLDDYSEMGHPYVRDYMLSSDFTWVLCMSPLMSKLLSQSDFMEADITYKASVEFQYLFNAVVFNYTTLRCKYLIFYLIYYTPYTDFTLYLSYTVYIS